MIPKIVVEEKTPRIGGPIQLSTIFKVDGKSFALLTDTSENRTILSDVPSELGEEAGLLLKGLDTSPGAPLDLDTKTKVEGYGIFTFPYGPVTYGISEAGGFKFVTYGERILKVIPIVNYKKRGVEQKALGMRPTDALMLIERSAGNFSASYSTCFVTATEEALGITAPSAATWTRAVAIELERIYNHLHLFSREAEAATQNVAAYQTGALKEEVLRLNSKYFGHRYLFGFNTVGGVNCPALESREKRDELYTSVRNISKEFSGLVDYFLSSRIFLDRLQNTARLSKENALTLGAVGPVARGSGVDWDDRISYPIEPYGDIFVDVQTETAGDAMSRIMVRINEVASSATVIRELLDKMPGGNLRVGSESSGTQSSSIPSSSGFSFCRVECPSGDLIQIVKILPNGRISFLHIRPASLVNWIPFAKSLEGNVFTDFQFAFDSFGLNYADSDR